MAGARSGHFSFLPLALSPSPLLPSDAACNIRLVRSQNAPSRGARKCIGCVRIL